MAMTVSAAPIDGAAVLPDALIEQYVKPGGDQVALIGALRLAAIDWVERRTARSLGRRVWTAHADGFTSKLTLPCDPVRSVLSLHYTDHAGLSINAIGLFRLSGREILSATDIRWPQAAARSVTILFEAGYDDIASEAPALQIAALMLVKHLFDGGSLDDVPATVRMLVDQGYRSPVMSGC